MVKYEIRAKYPPQILEWALGGRDVKTDMIRRVLERRAQYSEPIALYEIIEKEIKV